VLPLPLDVISNLCRTINNTKKWFFYMKNSWAPTPVGLILLLKLQRTSFVFVTFCRLEMNEEGERRELHS
jgi:hypothetical protein